jgi:hypothetical protein
MEGVLSRGLGHVLVGANTGGFQRLGGELLILIGDEMAAEGELVDVSTLTTEIEDTDLEAAGFSLHSNLRGDWERTLGSGTPRLYLDFG